MKIAVIGAGSWGTALAKLLSEKQDNVWLWGRRSELIDSMVRNRENQDYLPEIRLPERLLLTADLMKAVQDAAVILLVNPSHAMREMSQRVAPYVGANALLVSAAKGLELHTYKRMSEILAEEIPAADGRIAVLSGPNHAEEVGQGFPAATVIASNNQETAEKLQGLLITDSFRPYTNSDVIGVELGGALKNIIALCAGIAEGLGFGDNTKAALMTRGLAEICRLGTAMGARPETFAGISGVGDLIVTCTSRHSRNHRAGLMIAQGQTIQEIQENSHMVVEGIRAAQAANELAAKYQIEMPITQEAYAVLYQGKDPREAVLDLMTRDRTHELS